MTKIRTAKVRPCCEACTDRALERSLTTRYESILPRKKRELYEHRAKSRDSLITARAFNESKIFVDFLVREVNRWIDNTPAHIAKAIYERAMANFDKTMKQTGYSRTQLNRRVLNVKRRMAADAGESAADEAADSAARAAETPSQLEARVENAAQAVGLAGRAAEVVAMIELQAYVVQQVVWADNSTNGVPESLCLEHDLYANPLFAEEQRRRIEGEYRERRAAGLLDAQDISRSKGPQYAKQRGYKGWLGITFAILEELPESATRRLFSSRVFRMIDRCRRSLRWQKECRDYAKKRRVAGLSVKPSLPAGFNWLSQLYPGPAGESSREIANVIHGQVKRAA